MNDTATDCVSCAGGGGVTPTVMVNDCVQFDTAPSVSVMVQVAVPVTAPEVEAARPVTVAVTPSAFRTTEADGSEKL